MALTHVATSTPAFNQTNVAPAIPAGLAVGDHAFLWATAKQWTKDFDPATFGGWTLMQSLLLPDVLPSGQVNGTAGQGQVRVGLFYQKVPVGGLAATTIALTGAGSGATTLASGTISVWRSSTGADLDLSTAVGFDVTTVTSFTYSADVDPGFTVGDQALLFSALSDDGPGWNTIGLTAPGVTFSALTELADLGSALGDDSRVGVFAGTVTDGTSSGVATFAGTNSAGAGSYGGTVFVRAREAGGSPPVDTPTTGAAVGSWQFVGSASGSSPAISTATGAATGAWSFAGSATGTSPAVTPAGGAAAGSWAFTGTASGATDRSGTASGAWQFAGTAAGTSTRQGTATGSWSFVGTATGASVREGAGSGVATWTGTATGTAPVVGQSSGFASGAWQFSGQATGSSSRSGAATGTLLWTGGATGTAPALGQATGSAAGNLAWVGTANGAKQATGSAAGATAWTGTASGLTATSGTAIGSWLYVGTAIGRTPAVGRDITLTVGPLTTRALEATATSRDLATHLRARALTVTLED